MAKKKFTIDVVRLELYTKVVITQKLFKRMRKNFTNQPCSFTRISLSIINHSHPHNHTIHLIRKVLSRIEAGSKQKENLLYDGFRRNFLIGLNICFEQVHTQHEWKTRTHSLQQQQK